MLVFSAPDCVANWVRPDRLGTNPICALPGTKNPTHKSWNLLKNYSIGMDGSYYYFSIADQNGNVKTGETWSPHANSLFERLVTICDDLFSLGNGEAISQMEIEQAIDRLIQALLE
jgi:hypothetical protein